MPINKSEEKSILKDVDISLVGDIVSHGNRYYITLRTKVLDFWGIKAKDTVHFKIDKVKPYNPFKTKEK